MLSPGMLTKPATPIQAHLQQPIALYLCQRPVNHLALLLQHLLTQSCIVPVLQLGYLIANIHR
jgi:hypothetical protein